jgi:predicted nucleic-acid-binding Zn-ribbon protein
MSHKPSQCPKCDGHMERGFVLNRAFAAGGLTFQWAPGAPVSSFWWGYQLPVGRKFITIQVFRCESCGYLESYARDEIAAQ